MDCSCSQRELFLHIWKKLRQKIDSQNEYVKRHTNNNPKILAQLPRMIYSGLEISEMYHDISDPRLTKSQACDLFIDRIVYGSTNIFYIMRGFHLWKQMKEEFYQMNETLPLG